MKEPKDKRTKAWKEWKENQSEGLGDTIEKITKATGIKKVVELFTPEGKDCGCDKRKATLNKLFPYNKPKCLNEQQYKNWTEFRNRENQNTLTTQDQQLVITILRDVMNTSVKPCSSCSGSVWKKWIDRINKVYETY